ncbi:haloacid dehalogenase superfamily, subfamily IA, variant 3 with third motif having DD or ED/haloacid dehalogenase superfamily, subfamily IA, variant 1 with third motif having Dx(3-4)D or Dx(3-4)E [Halopseudomonas sabulinigri]|uniref:Haloacid dehalogenase superfamily, subfamily IA, variant 3 with third motif having DD or ED/haloacid dehalogenase superfamily, subfamily IA, variant 1 with third motif having Dx(3-4)D or Dx(3-4)E n=1 Tax=Halopseudomonas sabulinigri TaxID=472181 RepID=A0A1H1X9V1_9GAMM|nr:haloacid dehalogenase superfamily, subfamily IA, variant 3 with third motif having DD or ED/haloacid dehalogenase superfamily, subfamily IA, variant 1 with third motif having Dx(3-4)D or Dx(3-4)E [Halopseudomonas sabulinigri]
MRELQGWIFDLDGTLTLAQHDFPAIRRELGVPAEADILTYMAALPDSERFAMKAQLDQIELRLAAEVQAAPGAVELIRSLHGRGLRLGILTRNLQAVAQSTLAHLGVLDCFAAEDVLGREEAAPKPHPEGIQLLLKRWRLLPAQAVMVGDFRFDLEAGRAAGARTCLVHADNQWPALADWHVADCRHLLAQC